MLLKDCEIIVKSCAMSCTKNIWEGYIGGKTIETRSSSELIFNNNFYNLSNNKKMSKIESFSVTKRRLMPVFLFFSSSKD